MILNSQYAPTAPVRDTEKSQFPGVRSAISGLRYYNPSLGRWINRDPLDETGGLNLYGTVHNDLCNEVDVLGWAKLGDFVSDGKGGVKKVETGTVSGGLTGAELAKREYLGLLEWESEQRARNTAAKSGPGLDECNFPSYLEETFGITKEEYLGAVQAHLIDEAKFKMAVLVGGVALKEALDALRGLRAAGKLPRYDGQKPKYIINDLHVPGKGLRPGKTPLPPDAEAVFSKAVPNDAVKPTAWFGRNSKGQVYRFGVDNNGVAHFNGIDGVGDGTRNLTQYALDRLNGL